jgi:hypothetical protein
MRISQMKGKKQPLLERYIRNRKKDERIVSSRRTEWNAVSNLDK